MLKARTVIVSSVAAALLAWGGVVAIAAPAAEPSSQAQTSSQRGHDDQRWQQRQEKRAEKLKQQLKLTDAQLPAWESFQKAMQPGTHARLDRGELQKLTTPERIDRMRAQREQRAAQADQRGEAIKAFYAQLTPEQQKVFDARGMGGSRGGKHMRHGHGHGGRGAGLAS